VETSAEKEERKDQASEVIFTDTFPSRIGAPFQHAAIFHKEDINFLKGHRKISPPLFLQDHV